MNFNKAAFLAAYGNPDQLPVSDRVEIVFAGRSNVGKSSLINKLVGRKLLAKVSSMPGKTATINFYDADGIHLVDLPGYGYAKVAKGEKERWNKLIDAYFSGERDIGLVVQLVDMRHAPSKLDLQMIEFMIEYEFPFLIAMTKSDKLNKTEYRSQKELLKTAIPHGDQITMIPFSSVTGEGVEQLREIINNISEEI
ncbi:MAG: ribosome biogenesis GTP-binding protein YihA/YsxC [Oscillospiraceae bacterium]|nr:ribosome biogenesis GTP-binding protein YihA/YsxC [Oscillospiraceae bacterium]